MIIIRRKDAIAQGLVRYYTGKPCKHGHIAERQTTNGFCTDCATNQNAKRSEYKRQHKIENAERYRQLGKEYRAKNREKIKSYLAGYYQDNKEYYYHENKARRENNRERDRAYKRKWNKNNREYFCRYAIKRSDVLKNATPKWASLSAISEVYDLRDRLTKQDGVQYHVDHKIPLQGENVCGLHVHQNLQVITATENLTKSNKWEN